MRFSLLLLSIFAFLLPISAKDTVKGRIVNEADRRGVAQATVIVEYPDTAVSYEPDRKGRFSFHPLSFPVTVTARCSGMLDSTVGLMSMPKSKVVIEMAPDPTAPAVVADRRVDWSTDMPPRLPSTYTVRTAK